MELEKIKTEEQARKELEARIASFTTLRQTKNIAFDKVLNQYHEFRNFAMKIAGKFRFSVEEYCNRASLPECY